VTALMVQEEPTLTKTGWGFLRVEFDNGNVWESKIATIARPIDNLNEQEKACVGIAMRIVQLRKQQGISQTQLAEAAGTNQFHISKIESGAVSPTIDVLARIAAALGKRIDLVD
jgi:DNA-binding XRE family transcriptional regulator